jgi:hypothetical protein
VDFFVYEAVKVLVARWGDEAARSANTPADRSKRATQLSPGAALPALCLLGSGRLNFPLAPGRFVLAVFGPDLCLLRFRSWQVC